MSKWSHAPIANQRLDISYQLERPWVLSFRIKITLWYASRVCLIIIFIVASVLNMFLVAIFWRAVSSVPAWNPRLRFNRNQVARRSKLGLDLLPLEFPLVHLVILGAYRIRFSFKRLVSISGHIDMITSFSWIFNYSCPEYSRIHSTLTRHQFFGLDAVKSLPSSTPHESRGYLNGYSCSRCYPRLP